MAERPMMEPQVKHIDLDALEKLNPLFGVDRLLDRHQIGSIVGVTGDTIMKWAISGHFPVPLVAGGRKVWKASTVSHWINNLPPCPHGSIWSDS